MDLSRWREESNYVVQYNFCDTTQAHIHGEVVKIALTFRADLLIFHLRLNHLGHYSP